MAQDREIAFSTFLKLLGLPPEKQLSTLRGFSSGGGYDYWRPLRELSPPIIAGKIPATEIETLVARYSKGHQLKYNTKALANLYLWFSRRKFSLRKNDLHIVRKFGNSGLKVRIRPELSLARGARQYYVHIWATNHPVLSDDSLSMALRFFELHAHQAHDGTYECVIFDAVKSRLFGEWEILANAEQSLSLQREQLSTFWNQVSTTERIPPSDSEKRKPAPPPL